MRSILSFRRFAWTSALVFLASGCARAPKYGVETRLALASQRGEVWAVAPALNLSGQKDADPLLQGDLLYAQLQQVRGLTIIPVNRVVEVYAALKLSQVQSPEQAALVCDLLGADGLVVPTITAYDPYDPPKFGGALQMFRKGGYSRPENIDPRALARAAAPKEGGGASLPATDQGFVQAVGMFDAANGSVREAVWGYARGRNDPVGPLGAREYIVSMDRFVGFAYHNLIEDLLRIVERSEIPPRHS